MTVDAYSNKRAVRDEFPEVAKELSVGVVTSSVSPHEWPAFLRRELVRRLGLLGQVTGDARYPEAADIDALWSAYKKAAQLDDGRVAEAFTIQARRYGGYNRRVIQILRPDQEETRE